MVIEDLNEDGFAELIFGQYRTFASSGGVYNTTSSISWGSAAGFTSVTSLPTYSLLTILTGDLDLDGRADLVFPADNSNGGYSAATSRVYYGGSSTPMYSTSDVQDLSSGGGASYAFLVGDTSW